MLRFRKPMLAKNYEGNEHHVAFPCYVQPKMDGIRCVTDGQRFWSRNGKLFPADNLQHLRVSGLTCLADGELMVEGSELFEEVVSAVRNGTTLDRSLAGRIRFHVFDVVTPQPYRARRFVIEETAKFARFQGARWLSVETLRVATPGRLPKIAQQFLARGFEGMMVRNAAGFYEGRRTHDLLKVKPLVEDEFEIVDVKQAKGKDKGTPVFVCLAGDPAKDYGATFDVRPKGTMVQRRKMWRERKRLVGKMLTVEYQNLTRHGRPRFPRAKVLRDYE